MSIHSTAGQTINVEPTGGGGVKIVVECSEDVCERDEISLSEDEWKALVIQGFAAIAGRGR